MGIVMDLNYHHSSRYAVFEEKEKNASCDSSKHHDGVRTGDPDVPARSNALGDTACNNG